MPTPDKSAAHESFSASHPEEIDVSFIRASGPGGQNVNKVSSAVRLRFDVKMSPSLSPQVRDRLARLAGRRLGSDGVLTLVARTHRTQEANRRDAVQRLDALIAAARVAPKPRKPTRPTRAAKERRLREKLRKGQVKSTRRRPVAED